MIIDCSDDSSSAHEWLPAHDAYKLVCDHNGPTNAATSIVKRAGAGIVRARAEHCSFEVPISKEGQTGKGHLTGTDQTAKHKFSNTALPKEFWWAEGEAELQQNWETGDFSTLNEGKYKWEAFGVSFDQRGIEKMLAPLPFALMPRDLACADEARGVAIAPQRTDDEIVEKMKEMKSKGLSRDIITSSIREEPGFEAVKNAKARELYGKVSQRGRPRKNQQEK